LRIRDLVIVGGGGGVQGSQILYRGHLGRLREGEGEGD
jgi:hypothetical protein